MKQHRLGSLLVIFMSMLALGASGCGDDDDDGGDDDVPTADAGPNEADAMPTGGWEELVATNWTIPPPSGANSAGDSYYCASRTLTEKLYIGGFKPIDPPGTHHTVLSYGPPTQPDGSGKCSAGTENPNWIYASGVGTNELLLPTGVGVVLEAGTQVHVNLHLFNTSDADLSGRSGVEIVKMDPSTVVNEAEMFLPGPFTFQIPGITEQDPQPHEYSFSGNCTVKADQHIFALFPHMHQTGVHFTTEIKHAGGASEMLYDKAYDFEQQPFVSFEPLALKKDDQIVTTCTWMNPTDKTIGFGNSSTQEMCFSILMRYPRIGSNQFGNFCDDATGQ